MAAQQMSHEENYEENCKELRMSLAREILEIDDEMEDLHGRKDPESRRTIQRLRVEKDNAYNLLLGLERMYVAEASEDSDYPGEDWDYAHESLNTEDSRKEYFPQDKPPSFDEVWENWDYFVTYGIAIDFQDPCELDNEVESCSKEIANYLEWVSPEENDPDSFSDWDPPTECTPSSPGKESVEKVGKRRAIWRKKSCWRKKFWWWKFPADTCKRDLFDKRYLSNEVKKYKEGCAFQAFQAQVQELWEIAS